MWVAFANAKATHISFFSKNIIVYVIFNGQSLNDTLINNIISFEQLGPDLYAHWAHAQRPLYVRPLHHSRFFFEFAVFIHICLVGQSVTWYI